MAKKNGHKMAKNQKFKILMDNSLDNYPKITMHQFWMRSSILKLPPKNFLGGIFCPKSKINGHRIHDNKGTNFYNGLKWPYLWVVLDTELKLCIIHIVKCSFLAKIVKIDPKLAQKRPRWSISGLNYEQLWHFWQFLIYVHIWRTF